MKHLLRDIVKDSYSKLFASLYSRFNDIELVEDGIQDAFEKALVKWEDPLQDPLAWLYVTARNSILDALKSKSTQSVEFSEEYHGREEPGIDMNSLDEQLRLMCFCCHPALTERVQILLTLKLVGGLATDEIAAALVMKPKTVGQALTRAKGKIKRAGIPFRTPDHSHLSERVEAIRKIIYLMFNEGYHSNSEHSLYRFDLCNESIRLMRLLYSINRHDHDSASLLALLLFQNSRSKARSSIEGEPILLKDQNRKLWNTAMIDEACEIFGMLLKNTPDPPGQYFFQAAIAREYAIAPSFEESDWTKICHIFAELYYRKPDPIVLLSWVTAESYRSNPETALHLMESFNLQHFLKDYRWFYSARGELQAQAGKYELAIKDITKALALTQNPGEKRLLERRILEYSSREFKI